MSLGPGTRLGPYEIQAAIGAGGMGEVYRATDTSLGRQVAIKVVPDAFATDPERLARFEREAKTLAALNHPNIAHIYGLERSGTTPAFIMEVLPRRRAWRPRRNDSDGQHRVLPRTWGLGFGTWVLGFPFIPAGLLHFRPKSDKKREPRDGRVYRATVPRFGRTSSLV